MSDAFTAAPSDLLTFQHILYMMIGVLIGLAIGVFPGRGVMAGPALPIPFRHGIDSVSALAMPIGLVAVIPISDTFSSVLTGIRGSSASQARVLDGFAPAKQGQAARAVGGLAVIAVRRAVRRDRAERLRADRAAD